MITRMIIATTITMNSDHRSILRLMAWLSPVFPIGGFAYSSGLEGAVHDNAVSSEDDLKQWILDLLVYGSNWNDAVLFAATWRHVQKGENIDELIALSEAMAGTRERHLETMAQGSAFLTAIVEWDEGFTNLPKQCALPLAIAVRCADAEIALVPALATYLQAFVSNQLQAAIRLSIIGQSGAAKLLAQLEGSILDLAEKAAVSDLDDLGSFTLHADILSMRHETQESRIFRS